MSDKTTTVPRSASAEPLLDITRIMVAVRRKRRVWLSFGLLGLIAGGLVAVFLPPAPTAVTQLMVVHENDQPSDSGTLMRTDVAVLHTTRIAGEALKKLGVHESAENFLKSYEGTGLTNNMMEIQVKGTSTQDAVKRAQALADAFIDDHVRRTQDAAAADAKALITQRGRTQDELNKVNAAINTAAAKIAAALEDKDGDGVPDGPPNGGVSATETESLYARRAELTSKITDLTNRAEQAGIGAPRVKAGTQIVDAPRPVKSSLLMTGATNAAIGFGLALAAGITTAMVTGVVRDRPVMRADVATNLGASVVAQLPVPHRGLARLWRGSKVVQERRRVAATLVRLVRAGTGSVSVLELGSRRMAAALTLDVASELANDREVVIVEDPAGRVVADDLPGRRLEEVIGRADRPIRIIGADDTSPVVAGEARVGIGSVAPGTAWTDLTHLGGETLLVVRTGFANTAWLHTVARQLADARIPIIGVVLVDPDPRDRSDGTLWDGLHTALRGRAGHVPAVNGSQVTNGTSVNGTSANGTSVNGTSGTSAPPPALPSLVPDAVPVVVPVVVPVGTRADDTNGTNGTADLPTKRFAPVQPHLRNGHGTRNGTTTAPAVSTPAPEPTPVANTSTSTTGEQSVHDLPTKRFAPVRPEDVEELLRRRNKG
ncbi:Wzz/FepE/Etk N-terminal domain-containing protein [Actinophytocola sp.]|uniref:Wzz/FepE/Etk N-terminal domain-containing protein n=1 Tax=Actinophytocola sp. TaxID=1872138 RepID=UPI002ED86C98